VLMISMIILGATLLDDVLANLSVRNRVYQESEPGDAKAPDFPESLIWLGNKDASYSDKATLIHFWSPSCVTCIGTYKHNSALRNRYEQYGLKIISVTSDSYEFDFSPSTLIDFMRANDIKSPAAYDAEYELDDEFARLSDTFSLSRDSAVVLVDKDKNIRHVNIDGANTYTTELVIQGLLNEAGVKDKFPQPIGSQADGSQVTGALFFGDIDLTKNSFVGSQEFTLEETTYGDESSLNITQGQWTLSGTWRGADRNIQAVSNGYLSTVFSGNEVYIVAESEQEDFIGVTVNDEVQARSKDVDKDGLIAINKPGVYKIVSSDKQLKNARLTLSVPDNGKVYHLMVLSN